MRSTNSEAFTVTHKLLFYAMRGRVGITVCRRELFGQT